MSQADQNRLRIALQKSGRLTQYSLDLFSRAGLTFTQSKDQLFCYGQNMPVDILLVRDDDIPGLVGDGVCDLGIAGLNVIEEKRLSGGSNGEIQPFERVMPLEFGRCRLSIAGPSDESFGGADDLAGKRIATSYPGLLGRYLRDKGIAADIVHFSGAVEIAPRLGCADVICDLVSTGSTLAANHLAEYVSILDSQAWIIRHAGLDDADKTALLARLLQRVEGVQQVRESKYIMLHAPREAIAAIRQLLPGSEAPTVLPLEGQPDRVALHAVCHENVFWETLESLKEAGASSVLVLPVEKMLA
ncbi:MAG: ATP phosphoribosyltransferase [Pseudomonadota bacterium]